MKWSSYDRGQGINGCFWLGKAYGSPGISIEAGFGRRAMLEFEFGGEERDFMLSIGLVFVFAFIGFRDFMPKRWRRRSYAWAERKATELGSGHYAYQLDPFEGRAIGVRIFNWSVWFDFWKSYGSWSRDDRRHLPWNGNGWDWSVDMKRLLLGRVRVQEKDRETYDARVVMPEGTYFATVTIWRCRWKRFIWPARWWWRAEVKVPGGVPFPGKGENAWDCGDDARFSITFGVQKRRPDVHRKCEEFAMEVLRNRHRIAKDMPQDAVASATVKPVDEA